MEGWRCSVEFWTSAIAHLSSSPGTRRMDCAPRIGVDESREERAVGGVQGSPDWFEWTQTAELPPAPPVYPSARLPVYPSSRLPVLPVYPSATVLPVFPPSRLPGFPARSRLLTIWSLYGLLSSSLLASQKPSPMSYGWQSRPGLELRTRLLQLGGFTRLSSTPFVRFWSALPQVLSTRSSSQAWFLAASRWAAWKECIETSER